MKHQIRQSNKATRKAQSVYMSFIYNTLSEIDQKLPGTFEEVPEVEEVYFDFTIADELFEGRD